MPSTAAQTPVLCHRERIAQVMAKYELDALCVSEGLNVYYLSNYDSSLQWYWEDVAFVIYPRAASRPPVLLIPTLNLPMLITNPTWIQDVRTYTLRGSGMEIPTPDLYPPVREGVPLSDYDRRRLQMIEEAEPLRTNDPESALAAAMKELGLSRARVGCDSLRTGKKLTDGLAPDVTIVDARDILREIRLVKTPTEVDLLREAAHRDERALQAAINATCPGALWPDIVNAYKIEMLRQGGEPFRLGGGRFGAPGPLEAGDIVFYDAFGHYRHYYGDVGRTAYLGEAPSHVKKRLGALKVGWEEGCRSLRPGTHSHAAGDIVREAVRKAGFTDFEIATPHSLGLEHFDHPQDKGFYQDFVFEENTVISVDMPFFEVGWGMLLVEDSMVIRPDGAEFLSSNRTDLLELPLTTR